ncbi:hypothetical protein LAD12857_40760 [Lacrimispora amygdalina]|uniref:DUF1700 domain-containing protein n=1 Tax=Lacrimispora amygdalina TaxID=253257 RepID=A0A3E2N502_9FIRM|nr:DUF1700 domain-containing protein [Clostridium indicum]RFZ76068.1 DUF1700 domain-containing protein [Clostridium indicum]
MSRQEFLQRLRDTLTGEVSGSVVEENIRYYEEYIRGEVLKGSSEEAVTEAIGDPRLIAKTIIEASENAKESSSSGSGSFYSSFSGKDQNVYEEPGQERRGMHYYDLSKWYWKLLGVVAIVLFFFLAATIVTGIFSLLAPLMGPLLLIGLIYWFIKGLKR